MKRAPGRGMATPSRDSAINLEHVRRGRRGSVREDSVSAMSEMVFAVQGSGIARAGLRWPTAGRVVSYTCFPPFPMIWIVLSRIRVTSQPLLLIAPCWPNKPWFQLLCHLLTGPPAQLPIRPDLLTQLNSRIRYDQPQTLKLCVWQLGGDTSLLVCSQGVRNTVLNARAPSTRALYQNRWKLFLRWCNDHQLNHQRCSISDILEFCKVYWRWAGHTLQ